MHSAYIISLKKSEHLLTELAKYNVSGTFITGIDGKKLNKLELTKEVGSFYSTILPRSVIGCGLSHILAWREFLKTDKEHIIIFEDDVILEPNFDELYTKAIENVPRDFDILYLGCFGCHSDRNFFTTIGDKLQLSTGPMQTVNQYIKTPNIALGAHAYVISRRGAETLIRLLDKKLYFHIDYCLQRLAKAEKIKTYVTTPRIAYQTSTDRVELSSNANNSHPLLFNYLLSNIHIDNKVRLNYLFTVSILTIGPFNITIWSIIFLLIGIFLGNRNFNFKDITFVYLLLSIPDLLIGNVSNIVCHYFLLITPFFLIKNKNDI
uniref:Glycosyl transferase family 25 domain-containing protein n=1 Tax=viral metagenome TaxID=1070528 RepID=A0A6C0CZS7_9ZZZZ